MIKMGIRNISCMLQLWLLTSPSSSFTPIAFAVSNANNVKSSSLRDSRLQESASPTTLDYEVEPALIRIGHGFDIHRMSPLEKAGQPVVIGGVVIDHKDQKWLDVEGTYVEAGGIFETQLGVEAHSDGDVIYHSVVDAIFGALTLPDIGQVFQDTDPRWKGCDSSK